MMEETNLLMWNGTPAGMKVSLKRLSYTGSTQGSSYKVLTTSTPNDGSQTFTIPTSVTAASDWRLWVVDAAGAASAVSSTGNITINNTIAANNPPATPICIGMACPSTANVGKSVSFPFALSDPDGDRVKVQVNWGDGGSSMNSLYVTGSGNVTLSHTYSLPGSKTIYYTAYDINGAGSAVRSKTITVYDSSPVVTNLSGNQTITTGGSNYTLRGTVTAGQGDTLTKVTAAVIGSGISRSNTTSMTSSAISTTTFNLNNFTFNLSTFSYMGTYTIGIWAKTVKYPNGIRLFKYGTTNPAAFTITVNPASALAAPANLNTSNITASSAGLSWNAVNTATVYRYLLCDNSSFKGYDDTTSAHDWRCRTNTLSGTSVTVRSLDSGKTWHWKVSAGKSNAGGNWSSPNSFTSASTTNPANELITMSAPERTASSQGTEKITQPHVADPVNPATGNYTYSRTDLNLPGIGIDFEWSRFYNSTAAAINGPLGYGWGHSFNYNLTGMGTAEITVKRADGAASAFTKMGTENGITGYQSKNGDANETLTYTGADGNYTFAQPDGMKYFFNSTGKLVGSEDRNRNSMTFSYTAGNMTTITDTAGRSYTLTYDASNRISKITDPATRFVNYAYDANGNLITITDLNSKNWQLQYDGSHQLTVATDPKGNNYVQSTYTSGKVTRQLDAKGNSTTFSYDTANRTTTVTVSNPLSNATIYGYDANYRLIKLTHPDNTFRAYTYDANFNKTSEKDENGNLYKFTYDSEGNVTSKTDPLSKVSTFTYDSLSNLLTATDPLGGVITNTYDSRGNLTQTTDQPGNKTSYAYDNYGRVISKTDPLGNKTTYSYDSNGNITTITDPLENKTTYSYNTAGRIKTTTDPLGNSTAYTYSNTGKVLTETDALSKVVTYTYNNNDILKTVTDKNNNVTTYTYDANDLLISEIDPLNNSISNTYDAANNKKTVTDKKRNTTTYTYDNRNRIVSIKDARTNVTTYTLDGAGNKTKVTDARGNATTYTYDAANRLTKITDALGKSKTYTYDANGNRLTYTDQLSNTTTNTYDAAGKLLTTKDSLNNSIT